MDCFYKYSCVHCRHLWRVTWRFRAT